MRIFGIAGRWFGKARNETNNGPERGEFKAVIGSMLHDIQNPVQIIDSRVQAMKLRFQANPEIITQLEHIQYDLRRIFEATRVWKVLYGEPRDWQRFAEKTSVPALLRHSIKAVKKEVNTNGIVFVAPDAPVLYVGAQKLLLESAVVRILRNAVEAVHIAGRDKGIIRVAWEQTGDKTDALAIKISDNGCGIRASDLPKLAHGFTTRKGMRPNSGIGLLFSRRVVEFHNGTLRFQSREGEGTTISIVLPAWKNRDCDASRDLAKGSSGV